MDAVDFWPKLVLATLATWRLTHLLVHEDGPAQLVLRLRLALGHSLWGQMFDCFYCLSLWVAAPLSLWFGGGLMETALTCFGLSGAACLCERLGQAPVLMQTLPTSTPHSEPSATNQGEQDELLRTTP
jgi:hypothetical protein